jgi:hypothetical protein
MRALAAGLTWRADHRLAVVPWLCVTAFRRFCSGQRRRTEASGPPAWSSSMFVLRTPILPRSSSHCGKRHLSSAAPMRSHNIVVAMQPFADSQSRRALSPQADVCVRSRDQAPTLRATVFGRSGLPSRSLHLHRHQRPDAAWRGRCATHPSIDDRRVASSFAPSHLSGRFGPGDTRSYQS